MRPEWLVDFLLRNFQGLVNMGYHSAAYGGFLMERVGTVQFRHDGLTVSTMELANSLAEMRFTHSQDTFGHVYPNENRVPEFWRWKKQALKKRQAAGLPVIWPEDPELESIGDR